MTPEQEKAGWVKVWRCLAWSAVWAEMPYSTGKLWLWLIFEATHPGNIEKRKLPLGTLNHSIRFMRAAMAWEDPQTHKEKMPSPGTLYKSLKRLETEGNITREVKAEGRGGGVTLISLCNYEIYQEKNYVESNAQSNAQSNKHKNVKKVPEEIKPLQVYPPEVEMALKIWTDLAPLPSTTRPDACRKILSELHRIDGLTWDRINAICEYAARVWVPQRFIGSPVTLRGWTSKKDMKTWEAIERQATAASTHLGARNGYSASPKPNFLTIAAGLEQAAGNLFDGQLRVVSAKANQGLLPESTDSR